MAHRCSSSSTSQSTSHAVLSAMSSLRTNGGLLASWSLARSTCDQSHTTQLNNRQLIALRSPLAWRLVDRRHRPSLSFCPFPCSCSLTLTSRIRLRHPSWGLISTISVIVTFFFFGSSSSSSSSSSISKSARLPKSAMPPRPRYNDSEFWITSL